MAFNIPKALGGLLQALLGISAILFLIAIPYFIFSMYIRIPRKFYNQMMGRTTDLTIIVLLTAWLISLFILAGFAAYLYWDTDIPEIMSLLVGAALLSVWSNTSSDLVANSENRFSLLLSYAIVGGQYSLIHANPAGYQTDIPAVWQDVA